MSTILPVDLIQIEEPAARRHDRDSGISTGLELGERSLLVAVSIGGNAELIRDAEDDLGLVAAVAGYDGSGRLVAGVPTLADVSPVDREALERGTLGPDPRGTDFAGLLGCLMTEAHRRLARRIGQPIGRAVLVVSNELPMARRGLLLGAAEQAGIEVLRIVTEAEMVASGATVPFVLGAAVMAEEMGRV